MNKKDFPVILWFVFEVIVLTLVFGAAVFIASNLVIRIISFILLLLLWGFFGWASCALYFTS